MRCEVAWIDAQRREYPLPDMCEVLTVSVSGYRAWRRGRTPGSTRLNDTQAVALMKAVHAETKGAYGSRRMHLAASPMPESSSTATAAASTPAIQCATSWLDIA
jgi:hypothetical protein